MRESRVEVMDVTTVDLSVGRGRYCSGVEVDLKIDGLECKASLVVTCGETLATWGDRQDQWACWDLCATLDEEAESERDSEGEGLRDALIAEIITESEIAWRAGL